METFRYVWSAGPGVDSALIVSPIPAGRFIHVNTANPRLIVLLDGTMDVRARWGRRMKEVRARPGDALIFPPKTKYDYTPPEPECPAGLSAFRIRFFRNSAPVSPRENSIFTRLEEVLGTFHHLEGVATPRVRFLIDQFRAESEKGEPGSPEMLEAVSSAILVSVIRRLWPEREVGEEGPKGRNHRIVRGVYRYLNENFKRSFSLDDVGWDLKLSGEHVARVFKRETGTTVFQYLKHLRLETASYLLAETDRKVRDIAREAGFSSHALFSREFRKSTGASPEEYREQRKESITLLELPDRTP